MPVLARDKLFISELHLQVWLISADLSHLSFMRKMSHYPHSRSVDIYPYGHVH